MSTSWPVWGIREIHAAHSRIGRDFPGAGLRTGRRGAIVPIATPLGLPIGLERGLGGPRVEFRARQSPRSTPGAGQGAAKQLVDLGTARGGSTGCSSPDGHSASRSAAPRALRRRWDARFDKRGSILRRLAATTIRHTNSVCAARPRILRRPGAPAFSRDSSFTQPL